MARRSNELSIRVHPNRTDEHITIRSSGHFGKLQLRFNPIYERNVPLSPSTDLKAYWTDVLVRAQAAIQSM